MYLNLLKNNDFANADMSNELTIFIIVTENLWFLKFSFSA